MIGAWEPDCHGDVPAIKTDIARRDEARTVLFLGDLHLDNPKADREGLRTLLGEAVERDAAIVLLGDVFDVMQSRGDKRNAKSALRARYAERDDYLTAVLEDVTEFLMPYARHIWLVLDGNHERSVLTWHEVNITRLLVHNLNTAGGSTMHAGYRTYAALKASFGGTKYPHVIPFFASHGSGGSSPVTGGVIRSQRRALVYPDAVFVMSGHLHESFYKPFVQHRITSKGRTYHAKQRHFQVSAWKQSYGTGMSWESERELPPTVSGGWWVEVMRARGGNATPAYRLRFTEAD